MHVIAITMGLLTLASMGLMLIFCCHIKGDLLFFKQRPAYKVKVVQKEVEVLPITMIPE